MQLVSPRLKFEHCGLRSSLLIGLVELLLVLVLESWSAGVAVLSFRQFNAHSLKLKGKCIYTDL